MSISLPNIPIVPPRAPRSIIDQLRSLIGHLKISARKLAQFITSILLGHNQSINQSVNQSKSSKLLRFALLALAVLGPAFFLAARIYRTYGTKYGRYQHKLNQSINQFTNREYDYIIVGAGSAGCVLANRLSEDPNNQVLLIEAGGCDDSIEVSIPAASNKLQQTNLDWQYKTVPQVNSHLAMVNNQSNWPRGRMLGGSSSLNYMLWVRGVREDYDSWEASGAHGWSWNDVFPYFKRIESCDASIPDSKWRGRDGPVKVEHLKEYSASTKCFVKASQQAGIPFTEDYNGQNNDGVSYAQYNMKDGRRYPMSTAYLLPALSRSNLHVATYTQCMKVVIDDSKTAIGVIVRQGKDRAELSQAKDVFLKAKKEVILSAGAITSPHLLMLSGVGPKQHLHEHSIQCLVDSPGVGQSLYDHLTVPLFYRSAIRTLSSKDENIKSIAQWFTQGRGPLASCGVEAFIFLHSGARPDLVTRTLPSTKLPDVQFHYNSSTIGPDNVSNTNFKPELGSRLMEALNGEHTHFIVSTLVRPRSKGQITLASKDPLAHPLIDPRYLSNEVDVKVLVESCLVAEKIMSQPALRAVTPDSKDGLWVIDEIVSNDNPYDRKTQQYQWWAHYVRMAGITLYHPTSTVRMGNDDDIDVPLTVEFKVKGVNRLRVVDASAMPNIPSGNTNSVTIMMAERAAEFILGKASIKQSINQSINQSIKAETVLLPSKM